MATTPNYGWVTPAPTDFVTDLPADFETFADAVDADLAGLLGGTTGQALIKDSNADHDFSWGTIAGGGMTEIATATPSAATTVSFTSIPTTYKELIIVWDSVEQNANGDWYVRINNDSTGLYSYATAGFDNGSFSGSLNVSDTKFGYDRKSAVISNATNTTAARKASGFFRIVNAGSTRNHPAQWGGYSYDTGINGHGAVIGHGCYYSATAITQIDFIRSSTQTITGNFYLFGVN